MVKVKAPTTQFAHIPLKWLCLNFYASISQQKFDFSTQSSVN